MMIADTTVLVTGANGGLGRALEEALRRGAKRVYAGTRRPLAHLMGRLILVPAFVLSSCNIIFPYQPDQLCETQIRAVCHYAFACCNAAEREVIGGFFGLA